MRTEVIDKVSLMAVIDQIRRALRIQPFRTFTIKLVDGTAYRINHPDWLSIPPVRRPREVTVYKVVNRTATITRCTGSTSVSCWKSSSWATWESCRPRRKATGRDRTRISRSRCKKNRRAAFLLCGEPEGRENVCSLQSSPRHQGCFHALTPSDVGASCRLGLDLRRWSPGFSRSGSKRSGARGPG